MTFGRATPLLQYRVPNIAIASNTRNAKKRVRAGPGRCEVEGSVSVRRFWFCYHRGGDGRRHCCGCALCVRLRLRS